MGKLPTQEVQLARRAVNNALAGLVLRHGDATVRSAVNRWLIAERQKRAALAKIKQASKELKQLRRIARGR